MCVWTSVLCYIYPVYELSRNQQRSQKIFKASQPMDLNAVRTKLLGFGMQLLDGIDPNPDNFVCAGIIHTRNQAVGCLLRLEPNKQAQVCSLLLQCLLDIC
jgi:AP-2 complex subunit alpha